MANCTESRSINNNKNDENILLNFIFLTYLLYFIATDFSLSLKIDYLKNSIKIKHSEK